MNWHAIPGTTAEQRTERLPLAADSPFPGANGTNTFAGVVSDGEYGFGAFIYERNHPDQEVNYSTVNAHKNYFFLEREIIALGNSIKRVRPGDGRDIWTTLDQTEWNGQIAYDVRGDGAKFVLEQSGNFLEEFEVDSSAVWFHQNCVGYIVIPTRRPLRIVMSAGRRVGTEQEDRMENARVFQLAINHGPEPKDESYQYIVLPNTSVLDVQRFVRNINGSNGPRVLENNGDIVGIRHVELGLTQVAFYRAGQINTWFGDGRGMRLTVDRPALVMIRENQEGLSITVTDPNHSTRELTTVVEIDRELIGRNAQYSPEEKVTRIAFKHSPSEVYAGKPKSESFRFVSTE